MQSLSLHGLYAPHKKGLNRKLKISNMAENGCIT